MQEGKQPLCTQEGKTAGQEREEERRVGGGNKEKGADEAGRTSRAKPQVYFRVCVFP